MHPGALPARRSALVGRDRDVAVVSELAIHGDGRLLTLVGLGGVGKTTLAFEVGRSLESSMTEGILPIDLAAVAADADDAAVALACLRALELVEQERSPTEVVVEFLETRQALVILDNCEHVQAPVARLVDRLLDTCPYLRVLATSRAPLRVRGEIVYRVEPLAIAPADAGLSPVALAAVPAVALFLLRARASDPAFELTAANGPSVAAICQHVAGLPLAIELAAARVGGLAPDAIAARLGPDGGLLRTDAVGTPERRQTLEGALEWSHRLLSAPEQALFRRLSVFAGGWTVEAAEAVCSLGQDPSGIATSLAALVDQSLVVRAPGADPARYGFLQPILEFAQRKLVESGEAEALAMPHALYFTAFSTVRPPGTVHCRPEDLDRIEADHDNCLTALSFAESAGIGMVAAGLVGGLVELWRVRAYLLEAIPHLETALRLVGDAPSYPRAVALTVLSDYERLLGRLDAAVEHARAAVEVGDALGDNYARRTPRGTLAEALAASGDFAGARAWYEEARRILEEEPDPIAFGFYHAGLGSIAMREGPGSLDDAYDHLRTALDLLRGGARTWFLGRTLASLGAVERRRGELDAARSHLTEGFAELEAYGARVDTIDCLEELGRLELDSGEMARGTTLLAAARAIRDATAVEPHDIERGRLANDIERARAGQAADAFDTAWQAGRAMNFADITTFATRAQPKATRRRRGADRDLLTSRERDVATLVARGMTNRQIAEELFVAPGTVRMHVERILGKLGLTSRVQVATWVVKDDGQGERSAGTAEILSPDSR